MAGPGLCLGPTELRRGDDAGGLTGIAQPELDGDEPVRAEAGADGEGDAGEAELEMGELQSLAAAGDLLPGGAAGGAELVAQRLPGLGGGVDGDGGKNLEDG